MFYSQMNTEYCIFERLESFFIMLDNSMLNSKEDFESFWTICRECIVSFTSPDWQSSVQKIKKLSCENCWCCFFRPLFVVIFLFHRVSIDVGSLSRWHHNCKTVHLLQCFIFFFFVFSSFFRIQKASSRWCLWLILTWTPNRKVALIFFSPTFLLFNAK